MKKAIFTAFLTLAGMGVVAAQDAGNLVYNPSFEEHTVCPQRIDALGVMRGVDAWWQPTRGSSDYFHVCGGRECSVPRNKMGIQTPHSGEAYCGIYCSQQDYREYLQTELKEPLREGRRYRVAFHVSLADKSPHALSSIGALLTAERLADSTMEILMCRDNSVFSHGERQSIATPLVPQVLNPADSIVDDTKGWTLVCDTLTAKGGERFLTIGNFADFNHSTVVETHAAGAVLQGAYYYVDDVSVVCLGDAADTVVSKPVPPKEGETVALYGVFFDVDSHELLPQSYNELQRLLQLLEDNATMHIELRGHTDSSGTRAHNQALSQERAQAVADWLASRGIDRRRLTAHGYGGTMPLQSNATAEGRARNRRVEYRVTVY